MCADSTFPQRIHIQQRVDELGLKKKQYRLDSLGMTGVKVG